MSYGQKYKDVKKVDASDVRIVRTIEKLGSSIIRGTIVDPNGAVIPGVELRLFQNGKKIRPIVTSDADGGFTIEGLPVGVYEIGVRATAGFRALRVQNIELKADEKLEISLELSIDSAVELIGVVGESPMIDMTTNEQTTVFTRDMIDRIPGRRPFD